MPYKNQVLAQMEKDATSENWSWVDDVDGLGFTTSVVANSGRNDDRRTMNHKARFSYSEFAKVEPLIPEDGQPAETPEEYALRVKEAFVDMLEKKFKDIVSSNLYLKVLPTVQKLAKVAAGIIVLAKHDYLTWSYCETDLERQAVITAIGLRLQLEDRSAINEILEAGPVKNG